MQQTSVFRSPSRSETVSTSVPKQSGERPSFDRARPLVVDLEGALLRTGLLAEGIVAMLRRSILMVFPLIVWFVQSKLRKNRSLLRRKVLEQVALDIALLPANKALVAFTRAEKATGRTIVLTAGVDDMTARRFARQFDFIDRIIIIDDSASQDGEAKAQQLRALFPQGFQYAGDAHNDLPVWQAADHIIVVEASRAVLRRVAFFGRPTTNFATPSRFRALLKGLRLNLWAANALVFLPVILSGNAHDPSAWLLALGAFLALGLVASASGLLNDIRDLPGDRAHSTWQNKPLASGQLPVTTGILAAAAALALGLAIAGLAGAGALVGLVAYAAVMFAFAAKPPVRHALSAAAALALMLATTGLSAGLVF